ncbi:PA2169 family four-helix-bundle protein [Salipiger sp. IMCC34102]|uniref:PA2169 family four-helix-bundle protein n=1 Tax=Salipiger sp. IMCC34102 TaxID=2510647 RepID=UPI00101B9F76|nr:PA2169 family four-helix-bundle protein [Salipiger sp. IMCC34102]RYH02350.1 PA2169 family four-helix-bundle protein [Salipiger sp. IMCC34102]
MTDQTDALQTLHTRLVDAVDGWTQAAEAMEGEHAAFVTRCLEDRKAFHAEIHAKLAATGAEVDPEGSTAAALHREGLKIRDAISSGDSGILAECARGDGVLESAYDKAIEATKGQPDWAFLETQRAKVAAAREEAKALS